MQSYEKELERQLFNSQKSGIREFLRFLYNEIVAEIGQTHKILEIGAGAGISRFFLPSLNIYRTDIFEFPTSGVEGSVDSQSLPFEDKSFNSAIAVDVLHHLERPLLALEELKRVTNLETGGRIVIVEPYVSLFSYPIYRIFHTERTRNPWINTYSEPFIGDKPEDGDQALSRLLFTSTKGTEGLLQLFPQNQYCIRIKVFSIISFFITGGLSKPFPIRDGIVRQIYRCEASLPQWILKLFGSRCKIVIEKREGNS